MLYCLKDTLLYECTATPCPAEAYRHAVDVSPRDYRAWYGLGQTYELVNMPYYALYYFRRYSRCPAAADASVASWITEYFVCSDTEGQQLAVTGTVRADSLVARPCRARPSPPPPAPSPPPPQGGAAAPSRRAHVERHGPLLPAGAAGAGGRGDPVPPPGAALRQGRRGGARAGAVLCGVGGWWVEAAANVLLRCMPAKGGGMHATD